MRINTFRAFAAAALVLVSCATSPPVTKGGHKFAAAQTISASYNPSVSGLPGNVGDIVSVAGGATSWVKFGTGVTDWQAFPGSGGGGSGTVTSVVAGAGVTVDATDPANPVIASTGTDTILLRAKQLVPTAGFDTVIGTDFDNTGWFTASNTNNGTSTLSKTDKGGVMTAASSATASGLTIMVPAGAASFVDNARTSPWYWYARFKVGSVNSLAQSKLGMCSISGGLPANPVLEFGIIGSLSTTNFSWHSTDGAGANTDTGTGPVLDTSWHTFEAYSDATTVHFLLGGVEFDTTAATNIGSVPMMVDAVSLNGGTATNRTIDIDKIWFAIIGN